MNRDPAIDAPKADLPPPADDCRRSPLRIAGGIALIFLLAFAVYWPVLRGQFAWTDLSLVDKNPLVQKKTKLRGIWLQTSLPRPTLDLRLQCLRYGKQPARSP